ncbi:hypothetical protein PsYK624_161180 [Phanerochaete sordida]|uniref:Uncharacterized protein n=1 Tax=Phanerochaete sordida TaxID=48140 RepID=A0A9P3GV76_9APHY|nr:hypothetical protein PsYK624_161180 [Phanerochaete sordida]
MDADAAALWGVVRTPLIFGTLRHSLALSLVCALHFPLPPHSHLRRPYASLSCGPAHGVLLALPERRACHAVDLIHRPLPEISCDMLHSS